MGEGSVGEGKQEHGNITARGGKEDVSPKCRGLKGGIGYH